MTYKFRLYPNEEQERKLLWTLDKCRFVYNQMLAGLNGQEKPNKYELKRHLPLLKESYPELKGVHSQVLQNEVCRLFWNLKSLSQLKKNGKKIGRLRFKGKGWFKTFAFPQFGFKIVETGKRLDILNLSKIGNIPIMIHRRIDGKIKTLTIKKHASGRWFACFSIERKDEGGITPLKKTIGLDVGIKHFVTDSDGRQIENPKFYEKSLQRIRVEHQRLSRKKKGSRNREKQRVKLAKLYEKLENQRNDFLHKLSRFYVDNYDFVAVEDLNIKGMVKNRNLAGKILDASWGKFLQMLEYKAERAGTQVVKVNPRGTSKEYKYGELDRDYNASLNILGRGVSGLGQPFEPVEMGPLLVEISASSIVEAGSPQPFRGG